MTTIAKISFSPAYNLEGKIVIRNWTNGWFSFHTWKNHSSFFVVIVCFLI